uniref:Mos1 transposase HTH domain-containing protein n=1 Tax=Octopus bimaculoides TaxID=37653 RepID=A0A0L8HBL5_OCTBM
MADLTNQLHVNRLLYLTELSINAITKCEVRTVIRFLNTKSIKPIEIHHLLTEVYGESCMDVKNAHKWSSHTEINDEEGSRQPSISDTTVMKVEQILHENLWITLDHLCILVPEVSQSTIHRVLSKKLQYSKVRTRWKTINGNPPYSPNLAPNDYHQFPKLKEYLAATCFSNNDQVKDDVQCLLNDMKVIFGGGHDDDDDDDDDDPHLHQHCNDDYDDEDDGGEEVDNYGHDDDNNGNDMMMMTTMMRKRRMTRPPSPKT